MHGPVLHNLYLSICAPSKIDSTGAMIQDHIKLLVKGDSDTSEIYTNITVAKAQTRDPAKGKYHGVSL